jgi:ribosomal protein S18 acetylase RimI-like enzyme
MKIRPATAQDAAALAQIQVNSYRTAYAGLMPADYLARFTLEEQEQDWRNLLAEPTGNVQLVAETDRGEIAGYAVGRRGPVEVPALQAGTELPAGAYGAELVSLHVCQALQNRGIGRALARAAAQALHSQGCTSLVLFVLAGNPACTFYQRLGGQCVGEKRWTMDEFDFEVVEMAYGWPEIAALGGGA